MPDPIDPPVPLAELRAASTEALLDHHVGAPLRRITAELLEEVARRINAALADLDSILAAHQPDPEEETPQCVMCGTPGEWPVAWPCTTHQHAARIRRTLTGEDTDHA